MKKIAQNLKNTLIKKGADDVVISVNSTEAQQIKFSNNKISTTQTWSSNHCSIFMTYKKRLVITSLDKFDKKAIDSAIKTLISFAKTIPKTEDYNGIAKGPFKYKKIPETYDKQIENFNPIDKVEEAINTAQTQGAQRTAGVLEDYHTKEYLTTSNNVETEENSTYLHFTIRAFLNKEASGHSVSNSRIIKKLDIKNTAKEAALFALDSKNPQNIPKGKYDVILTPLTFANLVDHIGNSASIFYIESGLSPLANKLKEKVASKCFTLHDDPTFPNGLNSTPYDEEGTPTKQTVIIENGTMKSNLHNTSTAKKYKTESTGNAGLIVPKPLNLHVPEGTFTPESLLQNVKKGLLITNTWYTRFQNYHTGDFSTIPRDAIFYIENGQIKHAVKNIRITENLLNIMKNIEGLANNTKQIMSWEVETPVITPSALIRNVNISKPA